MSDEERRDESEEVGENGAARPGSDREELGYLVDSFVGHLQQAERRGVRWVGASPSPRFLAEEDPPRVDPAGVSTSSERDDVSDVDAGAEAVEVAPRPSGVGLPKERLAAVREALGDCERCRLAETRTNLVFGGGNADADLMLIGEAPGRDEDRQGIPFVGAAGQLLTKMLAAMGLDRDDVYITNILKCRPPKNRNPDPDEIERCEPFLRKQIDAIGPRIIIAMGNFAAKTLLRTTTGITRLRGTFDTYHGIPVMPTFHPAYLLRNAAGKRPAWDDLQTVMREMDRLGLYRRR
ncbi:MAG: uracil-DNA glycosylase [Deltaproteobacteria bacterium]|nr:uracil-DNA glycosylase [Deltaproteobacteria bacterium]